MTISHYFYFVKSEICVPIKNKCVKFHLQIRSDLNVYCIGYFCAQSEATIWLQRRQPVLGRPGHKALKANWLIALSSSFPMPSFWPNLSEAQMAARSSLYQHLPHLKLINFTNKDGTLISSHAQMSDEYHFTLQPSSDWRMKHVWWERNIFHWEGKKLSKTGRSLIFLQQKHWFSNANYKFSLKNTLQVFFLSKNFTLFCISRCRW